MNFSAIAAMAGDVADSVMNFVGDEGAKEGLPRKGKKRARCVAAQPHPIGRTQLMLVSPELREKLGKKFCDEDQLLPLMFTHGMVRHVRTIEVEVRPLGGDSFKVRMNSTSARVREVKLEISRTEGTPEEHQQLSRLNVAVDDELLEDDEEKLGDGEKVAMVDKRKLRIDAKKVCVQNPTLDQSPVTLVKGGFEATVDVTSAAELLMKRGRHLQEELGVTMKYTNRTGAGQVCMLTISAEFDYAVQIALGRIRSIVADPVAFERELQQHKLHVYIDDSNVFIGAKNKCAVGEWVDVRGMVRVVEKGRSAAKRVVIGSGKGNEPRFVDYKQQEYEVSVMPRGRNGCEIGVDDSLHAGALREVNKSFSDSRCLVLVTGDGNANEERTSFPQVVEAALQRGWSVEVWAWKDSMSKVWSRFEHEYG
jgi:hypothetical protein